MFGYRKYQEQYLFFQSSILLRPARDTRYTHSSKSQHTAVTYSIWTRIPGSQGAIPSLELRAVKISQFLGLSMAREKRQSEVPQLLYTSTYLPTYFSRIIMRVLVCTISNQSPSCEMSQQVLAPQAHGKLRTRRMLSWCSGQVEALFEAGSLPKGETSIQILESMLRTTYHSE